MSDALAYVEEHIFIVLFPCIILFTILGVSVFLFNKNKCNFWEVMDLCDWSYEEDDDKVLAPVVDFLSDKDDDYIFSFDDALYNLLHELYTEKIIEQYKKKSEYVSDDDFLYTRCVALINGKEFYENIKNGISDLPCNLEFESLLYVAQNAWAKKHNTESSAYPHTPKYFE